MKKLSDESKVRKEVEKESSQDGGYGWVIVLISFMSTALGDGLIFTYGAFYLDLMDTFDDPITSIMVGGFLMLGFSNAVGPFGAIFVNKFGFKKVMVFGTITSTIAISASSSINSLFWFNIMIGFVGGTTIGLVLLGAYTMPLLWFNKKRSIACSISYSGVGLGCMVYPIIIEYLINIYSIRGCIFILGALNLNQLVLAFLVKEPFSNNKVECCRKELSYEHIENIYETNNKDLTGRFNPSKNNSISVIYTLFRKIFPPELFKNISFWIISGSAFLVTIILFAIPQAIKNYIDIIGFTRIQSATFSITYGVSTLLAKIGVGVTVRYIKQSKAVYILSGIILAITTGLLGLIPNYYYIIFYGTVLGVTSSNIIITRYVIAGEYIRQQYLTFAFGWIYLFQSTSLFVALAIAEIGTEYNNYTLSFIVNGGIAFFGSILLLFLFITKSQL